MRHHSQNRWFTLPATIAALLLVAGCVELTGQRITIHFDEARDRLSLLIQYDGIHNHKGADQSKAESALKNFVDDGDVMFFDWFLHFQRDDIEKHADDTETSPAYRTLTRQLLDSVNVSVLGHYRDADDRIGVAQMVVINNASRVLASANRAIDEWLLTLPAQSEDGLSDRTVRRLQEFASVGWNEWLSIEGHSLALRFPLDQGEWTRFKFFALVNTAQLLDDESTEDGVNFLLRLLATAPLSVTQGCGTLTIRFGAIEMPLTMRCELRRSYEANLEATVIDRVPAALDELLMRGMHDRLARGAIAEVLAWGPAEEQVRAVVRAARRGDKELADGARRWLHDFGTRWNASREFPPAPGPDGEEGVSLVMWDDWYRTLLAQPRL